MDPQVTSRPARDPELSRLLDGIYRTYHYDFRSYAEASLLRRMSSALVHFKLPSLARLTDRVLADPTVFTELLRFLTVQVSDMFRDPIYFKALRELVVPYLRTYASLKIWVAGCATGEEAYSLAIVLAEEGLLDRSLIYATDINPDSLRVAEAGVYTTERLAKFSENHRLGGGKVSLAEYYSAAYGNAVFDRALKKRIVFSDHSLATDSAFAEVQLASCRNVLIYFERDLQERAIGVLRESICRKGFLGLGLKETLRFTRHAYVPGGRPGSEDLPEAMIAPRIIVIGGSAGALDGLMTILAALPATFEIPIVVVVHLSPNQPSLVPGVLERATALHVVEIEDKQPLVAATVHVAPANYHVLVERDATLALSVDEPVHFSRPSLDVLFESAARAFGDAVVGIVLSGANEDGALGLWHVADAGGLAMIQDATARHSIMPNAAIAHLGTRARVLSPAKLAACLAGFHVEARVQEHAG